MSKEITEKLSTKCVSDMRSQFMHLYNDLRPLGHFKPLMSNYEIKKTWKMKCSHLNQPTPNAKMIIVNK